MGRYLVIDGQEFTVGILKMTRKGDILDKTANRTEDGNLHREVIGTYYNYTLEIRPGNDLEQYNRLWSILTEPVAYHDVQLPGMNKPEEMYFGSVQDQVRMVMGEHGEDVYYSGLTCNVICKKPSVYATGERNG